MAAQEFDGMKEQLDLEQNLRVKAETYAHEVKKSASVPNSFQSRDFGRTVLKVHFRCNCFFFFFFFLILLPVSPANVEQEVITPSSLNS